MGDPCRGVELSAEAVTADGLYARLIAKGTSVSGVRQLMFASNGDLFAQTGGRILLPPRREQRQQLREG